MSFHDAMQVHGDHHTLRRIVEDLGPCWVNVWGDVLQVQFKMPTINAAVLERYGAEPVPRQLFAARWDVVLRDDFLVPNDNERELWEFLRPQWQVTESQVKAQFKTSLPVNYWTKRAVARSLDHRVGDWSVRWGKHTAEGPSPHCVASVPNGPTCPLTVRLDKS